METKKELTKEDIQEAINKGAKSISQIYKMLGGKGNISGSTAKKIREILPDIAERLNANKNKPTDKPGVPTKASDSATPANTHPKAVKPTTPKPAEPTKKPAKAKQNPFREGSSYFTCFNILAAHPKGMNKDELVKLLAKATGKTEKLAGYDASVLLSAKESPTGMRHRSCKEGFWIHKENKFVKLILS